MPRLHPQLCEVITYLGYFAGPPRLMQALSLVGAAIMHVPGLRRGIRSVARRLATGSTGGPDAHDRAKTGTEVVAVAYDRRSQPIGSVRMRGGNSYEVSATILAWGACAAAAGQLRGTGVLGAVEAFGADVVEEACAQAGIRRVE